VTVALRGDHRFTIFLGIGVLAALLAAIGVVGGNKTLLILAALILVSPLAVYLALARPLVFPFALYAFTIPLNDLLVFGKFGTMAKLLGMLSAAAAALFVLRVRRFAPFSFAPLAWLALLTWMVTSLFWSMDVSLSVPALLTLAQLIGLYIFVSMVPVTGKDVRAILIAAAAGGVCAAAYAGYLYAHGVDIVNDRLILGSATNSASALLNPTRYDPNQFAASLLLPIAIVFVGALGARTWLTKTGLLACLAVLMIGVYASGSRGAILAIGVMAAYVAWRSRHRLQVVLLAALLAAWSLMFKDAVWTRFASDFSGGSGRIAIWKIGKHAFAQHWFAGAGVGNFPLAFNQAISSVYTLHSPIGRLHGGYYRASHNLVVMAAVELGIIGLILLAFAIYKQWKTIWSVRHSASATDLNVALEASFVGLLVAAMFLDVLSTKFAWLIFAALTILRSASLPVPDQLPHRKRSYSSNFRGRRSAVQSLLRRASTRSRALASVPLMAVIAIASLTAPPIRHVLTAAYVAGDQGTTLPPARVAPYVDWAADPDPANAAAVKAAGMKIYAYTNPNRVYSCAWCSPVMYAKVVRDPAVQAKTCFGTTITVEHGAGILTDPRVGSLTEYYRQAIALRASSTRAVWDAFFEDDAADAIYTDGHVTPCGYTQASWLAATINLTRAQRVPIIFNGLQLGKSVLPLADVETVVGGMYEGCYTIRNTNGVRGDGKLSDPWWADAEDIELAMAAKHKIFWCYGRATVDAAAAHDLRIYHFASFLLTYSPRWSLIEARYRTASRLPVMPEWQLVLVAPIVRHVGTVSDIRFSSGAYGREYARCYWRGISIGSCATAVNPDNRASREDPYAARYRHTLVLRGGGVIEGGSASVDGPAPPQLLAPLSAVIVFR
jgi:hypothetical protein